MNLMLANFLDHLETFHGREFQTVVQQKWFKLLFHDTVKLRIQLEHRDLSIPISVLLFGIARLLTVGEFDSEMCRNILGKEWGFGYVARLLLECDDVCLKPGVKGLVLVRIKPKRKHIVPVRPLSTEKGVKNPGNGHGAKTPT